MTVSVRSRGGPHDVSMSRVKTCATRMLHAVGRDDAEVTVVLVDDATMRELNLSYRDIDKPTDVLSFAMTEGEYGDVNPSLLGDVVIAVPTARRQAAVAKHPLIDEIVFLLAHGLLHLLGFDHATAAQERIMKTQTERLLTAARHQ